jgi:probable F420-dependent oxidoreductase
MMRLGITFPFDPFLNRHMVELAQHAERVGYTDAWSYESFGPDAFSPLAAAAVATTKMRLGCAIVPVFTRPAALIAMSAATVQQISGGRFILGLGISTPPIVEKWMGVRYAIPHTRLRETVAALRAIFRGEKATIAGKAVKIDGFRLDLPLEKPPPIFIAAQGEKMLRLAGEIGDGLITNFITPERLPQMLAHVREGAKAAGRDGAQIEVVCRIMGAVDEDEATVLPLMRRALTAYVTVPQYNRFFQEIGYEKAAQSAMDAWKSGDRKKAVSFVPEEMVESIFLLGDADQCRARLKEYEAAGVTATALQLTSLAPTPEERRAKILRALERLAAR